MTPVLCNSGPLMALGKLNRLDLLADLYGEVQIPRAVYEEVVTQGLACGVSDALTVRLFWQRQKWPVVDVPETVLSAYTPSVILGPGETEVLALAQTLTDPLVLLDDEVARVRPVVCNCARGAHWASLCTPIVRAYSPLTRSNC